MANRKKLYFDFILTNVPTIGKVIRLRGTLGSASTTNGYQNTSRSGDFLDALAALTASSPTVQKQRNEVQLDVQPSLLLNAAGAAGRPGLNMAAYFATGTGSTSLTYLTVGGGGVASKLGHSAVFTRNFSVLLRAWATGTATANVTVRGVLVVQREHSMDV